MKLQTSTNAIIIVLVILFTIGSVLFLEYNNRIVEKNAIKAFKDNQIIKEKQERDLKEFLNLQKRRNERQFFLDNFFDLVEIKTYKKDNGFFNWDYCIKINNKSNYKIDVLGLPLKYKNGDVIVYKEYIEITDINKDEIIEKILPKHKSEYVIWDVPKIVCNEIELNTNELKN